MSIIVMEHAKESDMDLLYKMNLDLMEDEQYDRVPSEEDLKKRWKEFFLHVKYGIYLFRVESDVVGYAIVHLDETPKYLRHFFISRDFRRQGYGTECFNLLLKTLEIDKIDLDVMSWNERGQGFWKSLGFRERCKVMTYEN